MIHDALNALAVLCLAGGVVWYSLILEEVVGSQDATGEGCRQDAGLQGRSGSAQGGVGSVFTSEEE